MIHLKIVVRSINYYINLKIIINHYINKITSKYILLS